MDTLRIEHLLSLDLHVKKYFKGFSALGLTIEPDKRKPSLYILNTDSYLGPGEHWVSVFFPNGKDGICEFFDSFGMSPVVYGFENQLLPHCKKIVYNDQQVQPNDSKACGYFCIYFCMLRSRKKSMKQIVNTFWRDNLAKNDRIVTECVQDFGREYKLDLS